jgi:intein-encoded DNA endonuclease-like protein
MLTHPPTKDDLQRFYVKHGLGTYRIGDLYDRSPETIRYYLKKYGIPRRITKIIEPSLTPSHELAYILGVLLGDGFLFKRKYDNKKRKKKGYAYEVRLAVIDRVFAEEFAEGLRKIGLNPKIYYQKRTPNESVFSYKHNVKNRWLVIAISKKFYEFFKSLSMDNLQDITIGFESSFLKGFYESEGGVYSVSRGVKLIISNTDKELATFVNELINRLGFKTSLYERPYEWNNEERKIYYIYLGRRNQIQEFLNTTRPVIRNQLPKKLQSGDETR